jgi:leucyl aminopeptidase
LENVVDATCIARTLVNEPHSFLNAVQYSKEIASLGKKFGFKLKVFDKAKIEKEKMGGILAVNKGSIQHPTFNILEYKPSKAVNKKPIILVGKGVMYDTGGLSLKPTPNSMDMMKSDMGGSAAVVGAFCAVAGQKLPLHIIGLIPATDNRPGLDAVAPGDVITMYSGKTVEVLNTDAEGRLVLADALHYAKQYKPEFVIDLATLTGAAARAIGPQGVACMGNASEELKNELKASGNKVHERLVEFPMWEEYESMLKSEIADINNLGGAVAGQTTAGMFLQHFVDFPWMHLDIAGAAFLKTTDSYRGKNGTGVGVRLLYDFLKNRSNK